MANPSHDPPLRLNELDSPRRPNLRSPFADVFNNFWASFSTPTIHPNDTTFTTNHSNAPPSLPALQQAQPTPFTTPFPHSNPPVSFESSTLSIRKSISQSFQSNPFLHRLMILIQTISIYIIRHFIAIPLVCFIGTIYKIKYSNTHWGKLCMFALQKNNTALSKYRHHAKQLFLLCFMLGGALGNLLYTQSLSFKLNDTVVDIHSYVQEYIHASQLTMLQQMEQQFKTLQQLSNNDVEDVQPPSTLSPNVAHVFKVDKISPPAIKTPNNVFGYLGLLWEYESFAPPILLEDGLAVIGKSYCTYNSDLQVNLQGAVPIKYISIKWPKQVENKASQYSILGDVVSHFSINTTHEEIDVFQVLPTQRIGVIIKFQPQPQEKMSNCAYKIGLHVDYQ